MAQGSASRRATGPPLGSRRDLGTPGAYPPDTPGAALARTLDDSPRPSDGSSAEPAAPTRRELRRGGNRLPRGVGAASGRLGYQPALDGIRAFAVAAVLLYHAGQSWAIGGFLGVDAFFVLSGFLITSLLVTEWAGPGRIDLKAFWMPPRPAAAAGAVPRDGRHRGVRRGVRARPIELDSHPSRRTRRRSGTSRTGGSSSRDSRTSTSSRSRRRSGTCGRSRSKSSSTWSGRSSCSACCVAAIGRDAPARDVRRVDRGLGRADGRAVLDPGRRPRRASTTAPTRGAQSLLDRRGGRILVFLHGPIRTLSRSRRLLRVSRLVGAVLHAVAVVDRCRNAASLLYRGGFLLAALAVVAVIVSVEPARPRLPWARVVVARRSAGSGRSPTACTSGTGRSTSRSPRTRTGLDGDALLGARLGVTSRSRPLRTT